MNSFERALHTRFAREVPDLTAVTPGLMVDVHLRGRRKGTLALGKTYDFYDLASLTKIIFTASASMRYFSAHARELNLPVRGKVEWWRAPTTPVQLLTHTGGLDWWKPYYKILKGPKDHESRWRELQRLLARERPSRRRTALYSDLDLWLMGSFLEQAFEKPLLEIWNEVHERLGLGALFFHPNNQPRFKRSRYAPTERCPWRGKVLQGEVHDDNTWALGGVAPHAGLFGTLEAVSDWGLKLRRAVLGEGQLFGSTRMARKFTRRQIPRAVGDWGLGFMKPSRPKASCGKYFSVASFGHTGFTGTSLWMDPKKDLLVVLLSNRVHPTRENTSFQQLRPLVHDWICELL